jgi:colanic acid/amylovoran biosynthesis glycosyltransferase
MKIAYLVNQYPKVSHSFIRREISALEACGLSVARFSIRSCEAELVDLEDKLELQKTQVVLSIGIFNLLFYLLSVAITQPICWLRSMGLAIKIGLNSDRGVLRHLIYLAEACVLLRRWRNSGITHVHAHFGTNSTTVAMLCSALGGPPYSFTVHGPDEFDQPERLALKEKINRAVFVVAISSFTKSQLCRWCEYSHWQKIHVVRCGLDQEFFHQPTTVIANEPNLVCVGRLSEQKGQLLLLEAVHQLVSAGIDCHLTLVGDGPLRPQIEAFINHHSLKKHVEITGWASGTEVQKYITNSRALVLPSFAEGLPVVIMEALALQRPVISTYIAGIPELVNPGVNGWLVPSGSVEALTKVMCEVLQLPIENLEQMGKSGSISVKEMHNLTQEVKKLLHLFQQSQQAAPELQDESKLNLGFKN